MKVVTDGEPLRQADAPKTKGYKLKPGYTHIVGSDRLSEGQEIQLTEQQYASFADKFFPAEKDQATGAQGKSDEGSYEERMKAQREFMAQPAPAPTSHLPQDLGAKTPDLSMPDPNPGNVTNTRRPAGNPPAMALPADGVPSFEAPTVGGVQAALDAPKSSENMEKAQENAPKTPAAAPAKADEKKK
jgi:hypothetical protein